MFRIALATLGALAILAGGAAPAAAGPFGGFSADQTRYLNGRDQVCSPLRVSVPGAGAGPVPGAGAGPVPGASQATPACEAADDRRIAAMAFRRGAVQQGTRAEYEASARGTEITVRDRRSGQALVIWSAVDPVERITGVYASESKDRTGKPAAPGTAQIALVAVEYEVRFGGRTRVETVAFALAPAAATPDVPAAPGPASGPATDPAPGPASGAAPGPAPGSASGVPETAAPAPGDPRVAERLAKARKLDARSPKAAEAAYRQVLEIDAEHPEARYGLARSLARQRKVPAAVEALAALARSQRPEVAEWLVEARFDRAFASLRSDAAFRAATGLDRGDGARPRSLYERLLGFSDTWEQPEVKCEQAEVRLALERRPRKFKLVITTRCGGQPMSTRLQGKFRLGEPGTAGDRVDLVLPNSEGPEETVACRMQICGSEDCLQCVVDEDLSFTLLPVRR
jgi:hypothetical protein